MAAQIEVNETPDFLAIPLSSTGPTDPRYFFFGGLGIDDPSPNARLISEARELAMNKTENTDSRHMTSRRISKQSALFSQAMMIVKLQMEI